MLIREKQRAKSEKHMIGFWLQHGRINLVEFIFTAILH